MNFDSVPAHSFPHAKKDELTKQDNPGPGRYNPTKMNLTHEPHWKIGTTKRNPFNVKEQFPGPGTYNIPLEVSVGPKYTMSTKAGLKEGKDKIDFPGPATYKPMYRSQSCFYTFGHKNKLRERDKTPGPGNYNLRKEKDLVIPSYLFGKEKREDETVKNKKSVPGPGKYEYTKDHILLRNPNYSFGHMKKIRSYNTISPGPGAYRFKEFMGKDGLKKTMGIKYNYRQFDGVNTPGPGHYKESKTDDYLPRAPMMKIGKSKRSNQLLSNPTNQNPGPGQYNDDKTIKYVKIKYPSWKIGSSKRKSLSQNDKSVPGVGNYTISGTFGKYSPHYSMRIKGILSNYSKDVPGPGHYKNEKMNLYRHYPSWKIGTGQRDEELRRTVKEGFPGPGKYGFKTMKDFFAPKYGFGTKKRFSRQTLDTPGPGSYHIPCSIVDVTNYTREQGKFDNRFKFI
jgi:hypothetical protein